MFFSIFCITRGYSYQKYTRDLELYNNNDKWHNTASLWNIFFFSAKYQELSKMESTTDKVVSGKIVFPWKNET